MSVNKIILLGRTGDEIKMHHFDNGGCIGNLSLATNSSYKNKSTGEKVEGAIKTRKWEDKEGNNRYTTEINVLNFSFVGNKSESNNGNNITPAVPKSQTADNEEDHDNLPF